MTNSPDYVAGLRALIGNHPVNLMGASAIILDAQGRILLQKLASRNVWGLPGGLCELAEPPEEALRREVREETALTVNAAQLLMLLTTPLRTMPNGHQAAFYTVMYLVTDWAGEPVADGVEGAELRFFAAHELPQPLRGQAGQWASKWLKQGKEGLQRPRFVHN